MASEADSFPGAGGQSARMSGAGNQRRKMYGIDETEGGFFDAGGEPIVEADERDVEAAVAGEDAVGSEQFLKKLVIGGETDFVREREFAGPEGQRGLDSFGGEGCADGDRAIVGGAWIFHYETACAT